MTGGAHGWTQQRGQANSAALLVSMTSLIVAVLQLRQGVRNTPEMLTPLGQTSTQIGIANNGSGVFMALGGNVYHYETPDQRS